MIHPFKRIAAAIRSVRAFKAIGATVKEWFAAAATARKDIVNGEELFKAIWTALGAGSSLGVVAALAQAVLAHSAEIFPHTITGSIATALLTLIAELYRRKGHGA